MGKKIDLKDRRFGRLIVTDEVEKKTRKPLWRCQCDCGNIKDVRSDCLLEGRTKSCGCLRKETVRKRMITHGMCRTSIYTVWCHMIQRCTNQNSTDYDYYGGRGITICKEWLRFESFYTDMGDRPKGLTIERIDNNLGYFKENCQWATRTKQARNQRIKRTNTSGTAGVFWQKRHQKYHVRIAANNKQYHIGCFADLKKAITARQQAEQKYWG